MKSFALSPSCQDDLDQVRMTVDEARRKASEIVAPVSERESLPLPRALNRVLVQEVISAMNVPPHTNSAMDGYAVRGADLPQESTKTFRMIGHALAGKPFTGEIGRDECVRITTGASMPKGADTVVIQERVELRDSQVRVLAGEKTGQNVRSAGEDLALGSIAVAAGKKLMPADLGLIASLGIDAVNVYRKPRIAVVSTGDELRPVGEPLNEGQIYDSNRHTMRAMLERLHVEVLDLGICPDDPAALRTAFATASEQADVLISSGGVSVGEADFVKEILGELGEVNFWQVAMKPGRPLAVGRIGKAAFFGLPGNPVAVMVTFHQIVQPALRRLAGETVAEELLFTAICQDKLRKKPGRTEFQRGLLFRDADGRLAVRKAGPQGSGILTSVARANCFIVLPHDCGDVQPGDPVQVQPFFGLV